MYWAWEPSILIGLAALAAAYMLIVGPLRRRFAWGSPVSFLQQAAFYAGLLSVFVALVSPLDYLSDELSFGAHMAQHLLLMFVAPPLWLLGTPDWLVEKLLTVEGICRVYLVLTHPAVALIIFSGTMWVWHVPRIYDAALSYEWLHVVEHLAFMAAAVIGWWPALGYRPHRARLAEPKQVLYLFAFTMPCTALAALITLSPIVLYPFYGEAPLILGLTPLADQQLGGLLMWLPADMITMAAAITALIRWFNQSTTHDLPVGLILKEDGSELT